MTWPQFHSMEGVGEGMGVYHFTGTCVAAIVGLGGQGGEGEILKVVCLEFQESSAMKAKQDAKPCTHN
jgi:hypothetical protein